MQRHRYALWPWSHALFVTLLAGAGCAQGGFGSDAGDMSIHLDATLVGHDGDVTEDGGVADGGVANDGGPDDGGGLGADDADVPHDDAGPTLDAGATTDAGPPPTDAGPPCPGSPCQLMAPQCGCPSGESCSVMSEDIVYCRPNGTGTAGDACSSDADCAAEHECHDGICFHFCGDDSDCYGPGALCTLSIADSSGTAVPGASVCSTSCDVVNNDCEAGNTCRVLVTSADDPYTICTPPGPLAFGERCTSRAQCGRYLTCANVGGTGYCLPYCYRHADCLGSLVCTSIGVSVDGRLIGICN